MDQTIREKTEQVIVPLKAELVWFALLILAIIGAYKLGVYTEKVGDMEDILFNSLEIKNGSSQK